MPKTRQHRTIIIYNHSIITYNQTIINYNRIITAYDLLLDEEMIIFVRARKRSIHQEKTKNYAQVHQTGDAGLTADRRTKNLLPAENGTTHRLQAFRPKPTPIEQRHQRGGHYPRIAGQCRPSGRTGG